MAELDEEETAVEVVDKRVLNSKKITIKRTYHHLPVWDEKDPQLVLWAENHQCGFGCRYISRHNTTMYSGLTKEQESAILPMVTDVSPTTEGAYYMLNRARNEYYGKLRSYVPAGEGLELEIGLLEDNDAPMGIDNLPISPEQYIKWKALYEKNPEVAHNRAEAEGNSVFRAYIEDGVELKSEARKLNEAKQKAFEYYFKVKDSEKDLRKHISLILGTHLHRSETDVDDLRVVLMNLVEKDPRKFIKVYEDKDIENKHLLIYLNAFGILEKKIGGIYIDRETSETVANSEKEMIVWLKDQRNANTIAVYKRRLMEKINLEPGKKK